MCSRKLVRSVATRSEPNVDSFAVSLRTVKFRYSTVMLKHIFPVESANSIIDYIRTTAFLSQFLV